MLLSLIGNHNTARKTPELDRVLLKSKYLSAKRRLIMLDYDVCTLSITILLTPNIYKYIQGTLTPIVKTPSMAVPTLSTLEALEKLSKDPRNIVYIISGRDGVFLDQHLGHISQIGFSAEHGCFVKERGTSTWVNLSEALDMSWMSEVKEIFGYYTERTTGSFIEMKKSSITWHFRASDPEWG
jgi:trehalose 6-phosphate synthase/phosphatase